MVAPPGRGRASSRREETAKQNRKAEIKREVLKDLEKIMAVAILSTLKRTSIAEPNLLSHLLKKKMNTSTTQWFVLILIIVIYILKYQEIASVLLPLPWRVLLFFGLEEGHLTVCQKAKSVLR